MRNELQLKGTTSRHTALALANNDCTSRPNLMEHTHDEAAHQPTNQDSLMSSRGREAIHTDTS
ncbi:Hypothetical predicted protein [Pelobates cultripes]|uniref:Uncharacterized protein n=1 Tax=Pelobates cultripes TaxID=61616 RepID=A0AAD1VYE3_PELCU|nr:Hypothetical predicted protein [Pelobates cultripes]